MSEPTGKPRGRPRKNPLALPPGDPPPKESVTGDVFDPENVKRTTGEGRKDSRYFAQRLAEANELQMESLRANQGGIPNFPAVIKAIEYEASMNGVKTSDIVDQRTEMQVAAEVLNTIYGPEKRGVLEVEDRQLTAIERFFAITDQMSLSQMEEDIEEKRNESIMADMAKKAREMGKIWGERIQRLRKLRAAVRNPYPPRCDKEERHAYAAVQCLRYAIYVMRSNITERVTAGGESALLDIKPHHVNMAWTIYKGRNNLEITHAGVHPTGCYCGEVMLILPPGHGKTTVAFASWGLRISERPYTQLICGHANADVASSNLRYLANLFSRDNPAGRRNLAIFPDAELDSVSDKRMRLKTKERSKSSTSAAYGIHSVFGGVDASDIWFDDPVDPCEREQPEQRRRTYQMMVGQWKHRLRGNKGFTITTATLWHDDDANGRRIEQMKKGKSNLQVYIHSCGGPNDHPPFEAIWPEVYPADYLKKMYAADPAIYAAAYMCEPRPESLQIIKKLRYYDPSSVQHLEFKRSAIYHVSLDPSSTTKTKSDKAGIIYGACGIVHGILEGKNVSEWRLRIEGAKQIHATQSDLVQHVANFAYTSKVDYVHYESVNAFAALGEMFTNELNVQAIPHATGNRSKELRLRQVAALIENTIPDGPEGAKVFGGAVVEFPGMRLEDGSVVQDPQYSWLYDQVVKFGTVKDDHCLDAITQLVGYLVRTGDLTAGAGFVSDIVRDTVHGKKDNRVQELLRQMRYGSVEKNPHAEEVGFFKGGAMWNN